MKQNEKQQGLHGRQVFAFCVVTVNDGQQLFAFCEVTVNDKHTKPKFKRKLFKG